MIELPERCLRDLCDCQPLAQVNEDGGGFICCGISDESTRTEPGDNFRVCWKTDNVDEKTDWDRRDLLAQMTVISRALYVQENIENNQERGQ